MVNYKSVKVLDYAYTIIVGTMRVHGEMIRERDVDMNDLVMVIHTKELIKMEWLMEKVFLNGLMVICMKVNGPKGLSMDMGLGATDLIVIKDNGIKIWHMALESMSGKTEIAMKANGSTH